MFFNLLDWQDKDNSLSLVSCSFSISSVNHLKTTWCFLIYLIDRTKTTRWFLFLCSFSISSVNHFKTTWLKGQVQHAEFTLTLAQSAHTATALLSLHRDNTHCTKLDKMTELNTAQLLSIYRDLLSSTGLLPFKVKKIPKKKKSKWTPCSTNKKKKNWKFDINVK